MEHKEFPKIADNLGQVKIFGDRVLLKIHGIKGEGSIVVPEQYQSKYFSVVKVGEGRYCQDRKKMILPNIKKGDIVHLEILAGVAVKIGEESMLIADSSNIMCTGSKPEIDHIEIPEGGLVH